MTSSSVMATRQFGIGSKGPSKGVYPAMAYSRSSTLKAACGTVRMSWCSAESVSNRCHWMRSVLQWLSLVYMRKRLLYRSPGFCSVVGTPMWWNVQVTPFIVIESPVRVPIPAAEAASSCCPGVLWFARVGGILRPAFRAGASGRFSVCSGSCMASMGASRCKFSESPCLAILFRP